jgi:hypothetical protein
MTLHTLLLYLLGDASAIRAVAADPWSPWVGLLLVLSAGLARSYYSRDLLEQPWHLFVPLAASLPLSLGFVLFLHALAAYRSGPMPPLLDSYRSFLGLFWLTAPLAWLYAIPFSAFLSPNAALRAKLTTLAVVALWRVVLMVRVVSLLLNGGVETAACAVLLVADVAVLAGLSLSAWRSPAASTPTLFQVMGGISPTEAEGDRDKQDLLTRVGCVASAVGVLTLPFWLLGSFSTPVSGHEWQTLLLDARPAEAPSVGVWVLGAGVSAFFLALLPWTQPPHRRAAWVQRLLKQGWVADAVDYLSAHSPTDFPVGWQPPPVSDFHEPTRFLTVLQAVLDRPAAPWVQAEYLRRFGHYLKSPLWYWYYDDELAQVVALLQRLPEGAELAQVALVKVKEWQFLDDPEERYRISEAPLGGILHPEPRVTPRRPELLAALRRLADREHHD